MECNNPDYVTKRECEEANEQWIVVDNIKVYDDFPLEEIPITFIQIQSLFNANNLYDYDLINRFSIRAEIIDLRNDDFNIVDAYQDDSDNSFVISKPQARLRFTSCSPNMYWFSLNSMATTLNVVIFLPLQSQ